MTYYEWWWILFPRYISEQTRNLSLFCSIRESGLYSTICLVRLKSCAEIQQAQPQAKNGYYWIQIGSREAQVYCDMTNYGKLEKKKKKNTGKVSKRVKLSYSIVVFYFRVTFRFDHFVQIRWRNLTNLKQINLFNLSKKRECFKLSTHPLCQFVR